MKKKICEIKDCENPVWSKKLCRFHFQKQNPPKKISYKSAKQKVKDIEKKERTKKLHEWFLEIWDERKEKDEFGYFVRCFETNKKMYEQYYKYNTSVYHHVLLKSKYREFEFNRENIVIILPEIHSQIHVDSSKTPKIEEYTLNLKKKWLNL